MRIIGRIPHPILQITVFSNDGKFPVQFELGGQVQIYKFRHQENLKTLADVQRIVDQEFLQGVLDQFRGMQTVQNRILARLIPVADPNETDGLPDIF